LQVLQKIQVGGGLILNKIMTFLTNKEKVAFKNLIFDLLIHQQIVVDIDDQIWLLRELCRQMKKDSNTHFQSNKLI